MIPGVDFVYALRLQNQLAFTYSNRFAGSPIRWLNLLFFATLNPQQQEAQTEAD